MQLKSAVDADEFLYNFHSPYSGQFWDSDYFNEFSKHIPNIEGGIFNVWNVGCGKGEETYSAAVCLKRKLGAKKIKIYANDSDLLNISTAPNLIFAKNSVPEIYDDYIMEGKNGWHFKSDIKDLILFEYHDVTHDNQFPPVDMIIARDVISYLDLNNQQALIEIFYEKLKSGGILIAGSNEVITGKGWELINDGLIPVYKKI